MGAGCSGYRSPAGSCGETVVKWAPTSLSKSTSLVLARAAHACSAHGWSSRGLSMPLDACGIPALRVEHGQQCAACSTLSDSSPAGTSSLAVQSLEGFLLGSPVYVDTPYGSTPTLLGGAHLEARCAQPGEDLGSLHLTSPLPASHSAGASLSQLKMCCDDMWCGDGCVRPCCPRGGEDALECSGSARGVAQLV